MSKHSHFTDRKAPTGSSNATTIKPTSPFQGKTGLQFAFTANLFLNTKPKINLTMANPP